jgi:hypothetical protein
MNLEIIKSIQEKNPKRFKEVDVFKLFKVAGIGDWPSVTAICDGGSYVEPYSFECSPEMYIKFAKKDLGDATLRGLVNSVSNSKRAIHCSVDLVFRTFNLHVDKSDEQKYPNIKGFSLKLEILKDLGFAAPKILSKYNKIRNKVEHDYVKVTKSDAEDVLDVAEIFCEMLNVRLGNTIDTFELTKYEDEVTAHDTLDECIVFEFDSDVKQWIALYHENDAPTIFALIPVGDISRIATQLCLNNSHNTEKSEEGVSKLLAALGER